MSESSISSTPATRRWSRRHLWIGGAILAALGLAYGAAAFVLTRVLDPERLGDWVEPRASAVLGRDVTIGSVRVGIFPLGVRLGDVRVADPTGLASELASVEGVRLRVRLLPLLRRRMEVGELRVVSPRVALRTAEDGTTNYADLSPEDREGPDADAPPMSLDLRGVEVVDGSLSYERADGRTIELTELGMEASVSGGPEGWRLEGDGDGRLSVAGPGVPELSQVETSTRFRLVASADFETLEITATAVRLGDAAVEVAGRVDQAKGPERILDLTVRATDLRLADLLAALPDSTRDALPGPVDAALDLDLAIAGVLGPDTRPDLSGRVTVAEGRAESAEGRALATGVAGTLELRGDSVRVEGVSGRLLDGPFSVDGVVGLAEPRPHALSLEAEVDLARLGDLSPRMEGRDATGRVSARLRATGTATDPMATRLDGTAQLDGVSVTDPSLAVPVRVPSGALTFEGQAVRVTDLPVILGDDRLTVSGGLRDWTAALDSARVPYFEGTVEGDRLDLARIRVRERPDTALTYGRIAFARVGGLSVAGRAPDEAARELGLERPDSLPFAGLLRVRLGVVEDVRYRLENVESRVELAPDLVRVVDTRLRAFGGAVSVSANLALGPERDDQPFSLTLSVAEAAASDLLGFTTPLGPFVTGTLGLELEFAGTLDRLFLPQPGALGGIGRLALTGGGFEANPLFRELARLSGFPGLSAPRIRDWDTPFALRDGAVVLAETPIRTASTELLVGGTVGLGGSLDLRVAMDIPTERIDADALVSAGLARNVLAPLLDGSAPVRTTFGIGGTFLSPTFSVNAGATARAVTDVVQQEAEAQVRSEVERQREAMEDRARGLFQRLLRGRDTTRAAPADTVTRDTMQVDTTRPAPDTTQVDTTRAAPPDTTRPMAAGRRTPDRSSG